MSGDQALLEEAGRTVDIGAPTPRHDSRPQWPASSIAVLSSTSLALLCVGLFGWASGSNAAKWTGLALYALIGFGGAWTAVIRSSRWPAWVLAAPAGLSFTILVGFVLVEAGTWSIGPTLFLALVTATAILHLAVVVRRVQNANLGRGRHRLMQKLRSLIAIASTVDGFVVALAIVGITLCLISAGLMENFDPTNPSAFFGAVSPLWYVGALGVIAAIVLGLASSRRIVPIVVAVLALELVLSMSVSLAYTEPHSSWAAKHVGVTLYMMRYGSVNTNIDIYQAWPGLFSGVGWVCKAVGNLTPMSVARWWPPVIGLATVVVFQRLGREALGDSRRAWTATVILIIGNTIGQDYFSPQATGYLLAIAFYAIAYRRVRDSRRIALGEWVLLVAMSVALAVTHQLTPYMVTGVLVVLVVLGRSRSKLLPLVPFVPAGAWALANISVIERYFGAAQIGNVVTNLLPPGFSREAVIHKSHLIRFDSYAMAGDAAILALIALAVLLQRRTKTHFAWALCALSGAGLYLVNSYGNEGSFRVVLFAIPWLALLFADWNGIGRRRLLAIPLLTLPILYGLYLFANLGLDYMRAVRPGDVAAIRTFERTAPAGSKLFVLGYKFAPILSSARYATLQYHYYPYIENGTNFGAHFSAATSFDQFLAAHVSVHTRTLHKHRIYVLAGAEPEAAMKQFNLVTGQDYAALVNQFAKSPDWKLVTRTSTAELFELESVIANVARPAVTGTPQVGQRLSASKGKFGTINPLRYSYQWELCSAEATTYRNSSCSPIQGATHKNFLVPLGDQGSRIAVVVKAQDTRGNSATVVSHVTKVVAHAAPPQLLSAPTISGTVQDGQHLTASPGRWHAVGKQAYAYQWEACSVSGTGCVQISGANRKGLNLKSNEVGHEIVVEVTDTASNETATASSAPTGPVAAPPQPAVSQAPAVIGDPVVGTQLAATPGVWSSPDHLHFSYQWLRCNASGSGCTPINGAIYRRYTASKGDAGGDISVVVTAHDAEGGSTNSESASVGPVSG